MTAVRARVVVAEIIEAIPQEVSTPSVRVPVSLTPWLCAVFIHEVVCATA
jgi:hypothetical protein